MKKILILVWLSVVSVVFGIPYSGCFDDANLLKPETVAYIQNVGQKLYDGGKVEFTVKTVEDCQDTLVDGREFFNTTGIGDKEKNNGLLLFINAKNFRANKPNKVRLLVGYGLEGLFTDSKCGQILDKGLEKQVVDAKIIEIVNLVEQEFLKLGGNPVPEKTEDTYSKALSIIGAVLICIFILIVIYVIFIDDDTYSGSGFGGGGSLGGGFGSSGGFGGGGFGGGSCGGGGAGR